MAIPEDKDIEKAALDFLARKGGAVPHGELGEALAKRFRLTEADLSKRLTHMKRPHGESVWKQKLRRVKYTLVSRGELARSSERGQWILAK